MSSAKPLLTRVLHIALLGIVLHQLFGSAFVERPLPGDDPELPFVLHVWTGVGGLGVLFAFWAWIALREAGEKPFSQLVPWIFPRRVLAVLRDVDAIVGDLAAMRWPSLNRPALVSAIHGLGLLLATFLAASGALWYFVLDGSFAGKVMLLAHALAGNLMWAYLIGHAFMAILHHALGEDTLVAMFGFHPPRRDAPTFARAK